jgi:phosphonate transport system permease protein
MTRAVFFVGLAVFAWLVWDTGADPVRLARGVPWVLDFLRRMMPPDLRVLPAALQGAVTTVEIALLGTATAAVLALPLGFLSVEGIEPGPVDAITAAGATPLQILRFGVLPQVLPLFLSYVLYRLETNIRAATVLGFVGAGGIGFYLQTYLRMIDYPAASTVLLVTVAMVMLIDAISSRLRDRLV